jgi:hypothetical protein
VRHDLVCHDALSRHDRRAFLRPERTFASSFRAEACLLQINLSDWFAGCFVRKLARPPHVVKLGPFGEKLHAATSAMA